MHNSFAVALLKAFIDVAVLRLSLTPIRTLAKEDVKWEKVAKRFMDEVCTTYDVRVVEPILTAVATGRWRICNWEGHATSSCFLNHLNLINRLGLSVGQQNIMRNCSANPVKETKGTQKTETQRNNEALCRKSSYDSH